MHGEGGGIRGVVQLVKLFIKVCKRKSNGYRLLTIIFIKVIDFVKPNLNINNNKFMLKMSNCSDISILLEHLSK